MCGERDEWETVKSVLETKNTDIVVKKTLVFLAQYENLREIHETLNIHYCFGLAYLKHEHCSQQYSNIHVFISINCYRQQAVF
jgi:hypothetical protein